MTRGMSLSAWEANGSLARELALYNEFAKLGHKISIISWGGKEEYVFNKRFPWLRVYANRFSLPQGRYEKLLPLLHWQALLQCDIIKSNQTNGADLALRAAKFWNKPFVSRCGYLWGEFTKKQSPQELEGVSVIENKVFNGAQLCLVTTQAMKEAICKDYNVPSNKVNVIPNYVSPIFYAKKPSHSYALTKPLICQLGRLGAQKNLPALLSACAALELDLQLIGQGEQRQMLEEQAQSSGLALTITGNLPHEQLPKVLGNATICTLVSHYEGHPKALIEYMACGCTILATKVPGIEGLAIHEHNALLCETDAKSIQAGLERLLSDPALCERLGAQAREDAKVFSLERIVEKELNAYRSLTCTSKLQSFTHALRKSVQALAMQIKQRCKRLFNLYKKNKLNIAPANWKQMENSEFVNTLLTEVKSRTQNLPPADALRLLFDLDAKLYNLQGAMSVKYGNGLHTKHRHTQYHNFFVNRLSPAEHVLDIGCGNGALAFDMANKAKAIVTGIDLSKDNIETAKNRFSHPNVTYICGNALTDLPHGAFDTIVLSNVLEHLPERSTFLRSIQERLTPKRYLIRVPLFERDWRVPLKKELGMEWRLDLTHETEYTLESFAEEIAQAGLICTHQEVRWGEIWCELKV